MSRRIFALVLVGLLAPLLRGQEEDTRSRLEKARAELQILREAAEKIPECEKRPREDLVDPWPAAVDLVDRIREFMTSYADLPVAARARSLLPDLHRRNGDPAARIAALLEIAKEEPREGPRAALEMEAAAVAADWGDFPRGLETHSRLEAQLDARDRPRFAESVADWTELARRRGRDLDRALATITPDGKSIRLEGRGRSQVDRVLASLPMHPASRTLLEVIVPALDPKAPRATRRFYLERLLLFHPDSEAQGELTPALVKLLVLEGDFEKAWLHHRAAARRGRPTISATEAKALAETLARIARRKLDLSRNSRRLRGLDLQRRAARREPADLLLERFAGYEADYPFARDKNQLGWTVARAAFDEAPEEAYALTRRILAADEALAFRFEALSRASAWLRREEDREALAALLAEQAPRLTDPRQRSSVALDRARLLAEDDRPAEAIALLEPLVAEIEDPVARGALQERIASLRERLD